MCLFTPRVDNSGWKLDRAPTKRIERGGEEEVGNVSNQQKIGSGDGTNAHMPAVRRTQNEICFFPLSKSLTPRYSKLTNQGKNIIYVFLPVTIYLDIFIPLSSISYFYFPLFPAYLFFFYLL